MKTTARMAMVTALALAGACETTAPHRDGDGAQVENSVPGEPNQIEEGITTDRTEVEEIPSPNEVQTEPEPMGFTGVLSEDEFKALHFLSEEAVPPMRGELIELAASRAYLSLPEGAEAPIPGVVVVHEWWGLNDHIMHWADRLAADGYAALAVDLYAGEVATNRDQAMALVKAVDDAVALGILKEAHRFLVEDERVRAPRTGAVGWCFGGGKSLALALNEPELDACVVYYGRLVTDIEQLGALQAEILGVFGSRDQGIPPDSVADFSEALTEAGKQHTIRMYDAEHAFANPSNARYEENAASAAWEEVQDFLARHLRGDS